MAAPTGGEVGGVGRGEGGEGGGEEAASAGGFVNLTGKGVRHWPNAAEILWGEEAVGGEELFAATEPEALSNHAAVLAKRRRR